MDFNERMIPGVSAKFLYYEAVARYEFAKKFVKNGAVILDAATGTGYGADILAQNKKTRVLGLDRSREAIGYCRSNYSQPNLKFKVADITKIDSKSKYDLITAMEIIEHLPDGLDFCKRMRKSLKNGGMFIISTPNSKVVESSNLPRSPYHQKEYRLVEFKKMFTKAGFKKVNIYGQNKNRKAQESFKDFLDSQQVRQKAVDHDVLGIRKFIPQKHKELLWRYVSLIFGGRSQYFLSASDFPVKRLSNKQLEDSEYFVAVCRK